MCHQKEKKIQALAYSVIKSYKKMDKLAQRRSQKNQNSGSPVKESQVSITMLHLDVLQIGVPDALYPLHMNIFFSLFSHTPTLHTNQK